MSVPSSVPYLTIYDLEIWFMLEFWLFSAAVVVEDT